MTPRKAEDCRWPCRLWPGWARAVGAESLPSLCTWRSRPVFLGVPEPTAPGIAYTPPSGPCWGAQAAPRRRHARAGSSLASPLSRSPLGVLHPSLRCWGLPASPCPFSMNGAKGSGLRGKNRPVCLWLQGSGGRLCGHLSPPPTAGDPRRMERVVQGVYPAVAPAGVTPTRAHGPGEVWAVGAAPQVEAPAPSPRPCSRCVRLGALQA